MSIIEETLRNLEDGNEKEGVRQNVHVAPVEKKASTKEKPARSKFVVISICLTLFGLGAYYGLTKYQESLNKKSEHLTYNTGSLESIATPVTAPQKDVTLHENTEVIDSSQETHVTSFKEALKVEPNQKETIIVKNTQEASLRDSLNTEQTFGPPLSDGQSLGSLQNDVSKNDILSAGTAGVVVSSHDISGTINSQETKPRQELETEEHPGSINQAEENKLSIEPVEDLAYSEEMHASSLLEKNVFGKQLKRARHLISVGSHSDAIEILKPIIDRQEETWDTYLLMGAAYIGLGELDNAEKYSGMGLAINGNVPQLWLQCAIVEQERGNHEAALRILNESERLAPDLPEVQLNIGFSYDAIGNQKLSVNAYNSFLKLTEGNPGYMVVRYKVLERLRNLK